MVNVLPPALWVAITPTLTVDRSGIHVEQAWAQVVLPGHIIAVYATVSSPPGDTLKSVSSPAADHATTYITLWKGGKPSLYPMNDGLILAPNQPGLMGPQGTQIRLTGLKQDFVPGQRVALMLKFARAGVMSIDVPLVSSAAPTLVPNKIGRLSGDLMETKYAD